MPSLILFRHAKSDWDASFASDHERPLAKRGVEAARLMGRVLKRLDQVPGLAVSSSALRARETLKLAAQAGRWRCPMRIDSALYEGTPRSILDWIKQLDDPPDCLLLTGHEPNWSDLAGKLIGGGVLRVPTGCMLRIDLELESWGHAEFGLGELRWLLSPRLAGRLFDAK